MDTSRRGSIVAGPTMRHDTRHDMQCGFRSAVRRRSACRLAAAAVLTLASFVVGCGNPSGNSTAETPDATSPSADSPATAASVHPLSQPGMPATSPIRFAAMAQQSGVDFLYYGNPTSQHYMTEQNGGGIGLLDFDGDGWLDIFLANGSDFANPAEKAGAFHHLYRSRGAAAEGPRFDQVAALAGVSVADFGMGVTCADFNNDGFVDLYLNTYGPNRLWENNGDGTFSDVTAESGTGDDQWGTSSAFADLDGDGDLDLYVVNYVEYSPDDPPCHLTVNGKPIRISCGPIGRTAQQDVLYENLGNGQFADVSQRAGLRLEYPGKGLAVQIVDVDRDSRPDIYVANDMTDNHLFLNRGNLQFEEQGLLQGVAVGTDGLPQSSMGIACADANRDGLWDLFVTNFENDVNDFYRQVEQRGFLTMNAQLGLDLPSRPMLAFGTVFADFDLDQWPDLFVANGHIWDLKSAGTGHEYEMTAQLFRNRNGERFEDVSVLSGSYFSRKVLGRAVAVGDLDNDRAADLVVSHELTPAEILRNESARSGGAVSLAVVGVSEARQPLGVTVEVVTGEVRQMWTIPSGGSFQSSSDPRLIVPVGHSTKLDSVKVYWPHGSEEWRDLSIDAAILLVEGTGIRSEQSVSRASQPRR